MPLSVEDLGVLVECIYVASQDIRGDDGEYTEAGPLNISASMVDSCNKINSGQGLPQRFALGDRQNLFSSFAMANTYLRHHEKELRREECHPASPWDLARIWHSGFRARNGPGAQRFEKKIKNIYEQYKKRTGLAMASE